MHHNNYNIQPNIQSYIRGILFILLFILFIVADISAQQNADTTFASLNKQQKAKNEQIRFGVRASVTFHEPFYHTGYYWNRYITTGLHMDFPTYIPRMLIHFSAEAGMIDKKDETILDVKIFHSAVSASYDFPIVKDRFSVRPRIGLSNVIITTMKLEEFVDIYEGLEIFADFENEFGIVGGIEPVLRIKQFQITMPISGNIILSLPNYIITADISLTAGVVF